MNSLHDTKQQFSLLAQLMQNVEMIVMKNKVRAFINKHGYTYKSYFIALIVFPPACYLIAWKMTDINTSTRLALFVLAFVLPTAMILLGGAGVFQVLRSI